MGPLELDSLVQGLDGGKALSQKMAVVTIWTIINFEICMKVMAARADLTRSLTVQLNR